MLDFDAWGGGVGEGAECLFKIAMKQYLGLLIIIEGGGQNALFKIAAKQCLRLLMMLDFDAWFWPLFWRFMTLDAWIEIALRTDERTDKANSKVALRLKTQQIRIVLLRINYLNDTNICSNSHDLININTDQLIQNLSKLR